MRRLLRALIWLASAAAIVGTSILGFRVVFSNQPPLPVEAEVLTLAGRLARPAPLYDQPTVRDPVSVMPVLPVASLMFVQTLGPRLWVIRMLAMIALLGVAVIVASIIHLETDSWTLAGAGAGLTLAGYVALGGQPGAALPEPLMLALVLSGFLSMRTIQGTWGAGIAALLISVACFTQQHAIWFAAAGFLYLVYEHRRRQGIFLLGIAVLGAGGYLVLSQLLGPWFNFYAWDVPMRSLQFDPARLVAFMGNQLLGTLGALTLAAVFGLALPPEPWRGPGGLWMCMTAAAVALGLMATQAGGTTVAALTIVTALALIGPIAMQLVTGHLSAWPGSTRMTGEGVLFVAIGLQFVMLFARLIPMGLLGGS
jgi:hypothetical protein